MENKEAIVRNFISTGDYFNLIPVSTKCPVKFKEIPKDIFLAQNIDPVPSIIIKTGPIIEGLNIVPIFKPYLLITGSSIADSYFCDRRTSISISYPLSDPDGESPESKNRMQLGDFLHSILEDCLIKADFTKASVQFLIQSYINKLEKEEDPLKGILSSESQINFIITILQQWASTFFPSAKGTFLINSDTEKVKISKTIAIEAPFISIALGIQGKIDALVITNTGNISAMEIKSGNPQQSTGHKAQIMLYHSLLCYFLSFINLERQSSFALLSYISINSKSSHIGHSFSLETISPTSSDFVSLLLRRNELAFCASKGGHYSVLPFPSLKVSSSWKCTTCPISRTCDRLLNLNQQNVPMPFTNFFNSWHSILSVEQEDLLKLVYARLSMSEKNYFSFFSCKSFSSDISLLVLQSNAKDKVDSLRPGDTFILICDLRASFPNLIIPILGCSLMFKSKQIDACLTLALKLPFDPFPLMFGLLKLACPSETFSPTKLKYLLFRNERRSLGWRSQTSLLLDAIYTNSEFKSIFEKSTLLTLPPNTNDSFDLAIFKDISKNIVLHAGKYSFLDKDLHPAQGSCVSDWLESIHENRNRKSVDQQQPFTIDLSNVLHLVLGMPGCGKTRTLVSFIHQFITAFPENCKLLITTFTHAAIDSIFEKINISFPEKLPLFFRHNSHHERSDLSSFSEQYLENIHTSNPSFIQKQPLNSSNQLSNFRVFFSTILGLASFPHCNFAFEAVVIDEASQVLLPLSLLPLRYAPIAILIGDHCQLRPFLSLKSESSSISTSYSSFFEDALKIIPPEGISNNSIIKLSILNTQFRMNSKLSSICNHLFYSNLMETVSGKFSSELLNWTLDNSMTTSPDILWKDAISAFHPNILERSFILIDLISPIVTCNSQPPYSTECLIMKSLLKSYELGCDKENDIPKVTILAPYHGILDNLKTSFNDSIHSKFSSSLKVTFSTIDSMQGKESDFVILFICNNLPSITASLMNDPRRFNVAFSRASKKLVVVGTFNEPSSSTSIFFKQFLTFINEQKIPRICYPP